MFERLMASKKTASLEATMLTMGQNARGAMRALALASSDSKNKALLNAARHLRENKTAILKANAQDQKAARDNGAAAAYIDRLALDDKRIESIANGLEAIAALPDPIGTILQSWTQPNGLRFERVRVPLGVIGVIFESRPNVTADAGALSLKAGNACILRAGSDSLESAKALHQCLQAGLKDANLPEDAIQLVPTKDREAVGHMLRGLQGNLDVIVPRGGKSLVARIQEEARVPVFAHLEGICHTYIHKDAKLETTLSVTMNAKMRRVSVCGATETILADNEVLQSHLKPLVELLLDSGCEVRGCPKTQTLDTRIQAATQADWSTEYLEPIVAVKVVEGIDQAIDHIETYGSHHTDAILTQNAQAAERFLQEVDSAIVMHNTSTQFADGGEFGFGGEIGIATGRMHARGPVGIEQLTTFKYRVHGHGQIRP